MKKQLKTNFSIYDKIFGNEIHCYIGYNQHEWNSSLKSKYTLDDYIDTDGFAGMSIDCFTDKPKRLVFVIWILEFKWRIDDMVTLIHEISHTIDRMFDFNNIPLTKATGEFRAILISDIYGKIAQKIRKRL